MSHEAKAVANYFLDIAEESGVKLDPMKIQKLIFYAHGWNLALRDEPLISESLEAWQYGPVVPSVYHEFKHCGRKGIGGRAADYDPSTGEITEFEIGGDDADFVKKLLKKIWEVYGDLSGIQLSKMTHESNGAWDRTWNEMGGNRFKSVSIDNEFIKDEFSQRIKKKNETSERK